MERFSKGRFSTRIANSGKRCRDLQWLVRSSGQGLVLAGYILLGLGLAEGALASPTRVAQQSDLSAQQLTTTTPQLGENRYKLLQEGRKLLDQNTPKLLE
jgi:hypothetical protein